MVVVVLVGCVVVVVVVSVVVSVVVVFVIVVVVDVAVVVAELHVPHMTGHSVRTISQALQRDIVYHDPQRALSRSP